MQLDHLDINNFLRSRRSTFVADYTGEKIADNIITTILENASYAPTHKRTEPWHFKVFSEGGLDTLFAKIASIYQETTPIELFSQEKYNKFAENAKKVSHVVAICMKRDDSERVPEIEEICAVACAVQNIYLSITAYKLGGYWSTGGGVFSPQMHQFLELGEKDRCLGLFYMGVTTKEQEQAKRSPIATKISWIK
jgi:nitroreductase